jgi:hypothetical protein
LTFFLTALFFFWGAAGVALIVYVFITARQRRKEETTRALHPTAHQQPVTQIRVVPPSRRLYDQDRS